MPAARGSHRPPEDEWVRWHRQYAGRGLLARRLVMVQRRLGEALDHQPPGPIRVLSLCSGDGRDLLGVLRCHPRAGDVQARLVDLSPTLVNRGRRRAQALGLHQVRFRRADAGSTTAADGAVPADIVLACGIFGNVSDADVRITVETLPSLCARHATVLWTRGRRAPDLTPTIRGWFRGAGFTEVAFDPIPGTSASVGTARLKRRPAAFRPGVRMFTFLPPDERPMGRRRTRKTVARSAR